jgi:hypothetical protein
LDRRTGNPYTGILKETLMAKPRAIFSARSQTQETKPEQPRLME